MPRIVKLALVGAENVGKSSIGKQFLTRQFSPKHEPTMLFDFGHKRVTAKGGDTIADADDSEYLYQVWDCGSGPVAQQVFRSYLMQCDIVLSVYDCTRPRSFEAAKDLALAAQEENSRSVVVLVGNKDDLTAQVSHEAAREWVRDRNMAFMPCVASRYAAVEAIVRLATAYMPPPVLRAPVPAPVTLEQVVRGASKTTAGVAECCAIV